MTSDINENFDWKNVKVTPDAQYLRSSFPGLWKQSAERGNAGITPHAWMEGKITKFDTIYEYTFLI